MSKTTYQVLMDAADLIEKAPKLAKGSYTAVDAVLTAEGRWTFELDQAYYSELIDRGATVNLRKNCYCAEGAIHAAGVYGPSFAARHALLRYLGLADSFELYGWNDAPARTKAEVVAALCGAAERVKNTPGEANMLLKGLK